MFSGIGTMTLNVCKLWGNVLFNGFDSDLSARDKADQIGLRCTHFNPISTWSFHKSRIVDVSNGDEYCNDSRKTVRLKCAALFAATFVVQTIGLLLNLLNRIAKIISFAQLWKPSQEKYPFKARLCEWAKDLLVVVLTPLILVGMILSSLCGATLSPYNGRKLYASFERLAYSGGYQLFAVNVYAYGRDPQNYLIAPCFQPSPKAHLGGGDLSKSNAW